MVIYPYLQFKGNCKEALDYYANVFETTYKAMTYGDVPIEKHPYHPIMDDISTNILYAEMRVFDTLILFEDNISQEVKGGNTLVLTMRLKDEALLRKYFDRLAKDGKVLMPISQFFWSDAYGIVVDKFGIEWKFNLEK